MSDVPAPSGEAGRSGDGSGRLACGQDEAPGEGPGSEQEDGVKVDGFGIRHRAECDRPRWGTAEARRRGVGSSLVQRCPSCGVVWRAGDPSGLARPRLGYGRGVR